jgi:mRNA-degrading endonuclease toxin of MazEF toxin-antitoxin module
MASGDEPQVGQIVDHHFLWADEHGAGRVEGRKARPCIIIAVEQPKRGAPRVTVLPITSQAPRPGTSAVTIPNDVKARIGLTRARPAWVVIDDANIFVWPGYDLLPQPGGGFIRGVVTRGFFRLLRDAVLAAHARGRPRRIERDTP